MQSFLGNPRVVYLHISADLYYELSREFYHTDYAIEMWRKEYNTIRPHSALGYQPPVPEAILVPSTQFYQPALP